jgi:hypothetical protein
MLGLYYSPELPDPSCYPTAIVEAPLSDVYRSKYDDDSLATLAVAFCSPQMKLLASHLVREPVAEVGACCVLVIGGSCAHAGLGDLCQ